MNIYDPDGQLRHGKYYILLGKAAGTRVKLICCYTPGREPNDISLGHSN